MFESEIFGRQLCLYLCLFTSILSTVTENDIQFRIEINTTVDLFVVAVFSFKSFTQPAYFCMVHFCANIEIMKTIH